MFVWGGRVGFGQQLARSAFMVGLGWVLGLLGGGRRAAEQRGAKKQRKTMRARKREQRALSVVCFWQRVGGGGGKSVWCLRHTHGRHCAAAAAGPPNPAHLQLEGVRGDRSVQPAKLQVTQHAVVQLLQWVGWLVGWLGG